jgi:hypothetical protein
LVLRDAELGRLLDSASSPLPFPPRSAYISRLSERRVMASTITVTVPHNLGVETAKKRLTERIELLQREYVNKIAQSELSWAGDVALIHVAALGQTATARMTVLPELVRIEVELPWLLAKLAGGLQDFISRNANDVLRIGGGRKAP